MKTISARGRDLLKYLEGLVLTVYADRGGVPTIGYGHTGKDVYPGRTITKLQAEQLLTDDLRACEGTVNVNCPNLNQDEFDAIVIFVYNVGSKAFEGSSVCKYLRAGKMQEAATTMQLWRNVEIGGKLTPDPVLVRRRRLEARLLFGDYPSDEMR